MSCVSNRLRDLDNRCTPSSSLLLVQHGPFVSLTLILGLKTQPRNVYKITKMKSEAMSDQETVKPCLCVWHERKKNSRCHGFISLSVAAGRESKSETKRRRERHERELLTNQPLYVSRR